MHFPIVCCTACRTCFYCGVCRSIYSWTCNARPATAPVAGNITATMEFVEATYHEIDEELFRDDLEELCQMTRVTRKRIWKYVWHGRSTPTHASKSARSWRWLSKCLGYEEVFEVDVRLLWHIWRWGRQFGPLRRVQTAACGRLTVQQLRCSTDVTLLLWVTREVHGGRIVLGARQQHSVMKMRTSSRWRVWGRWVTSPDDPTGMGIDPHDRVSGRTERTYTKLREDRRRLVPCLLIGLSIKKKTENVNDKIQSENWWNRVENALEEVLSLSSILSPRFFFWIVCIQIEGMGELYFIFRTMFSDLGVVGESAPAHHDVHLVASFGHKKEANKSIVRLKKVSLKKSCKRICKQTLFLGGISNKDAAYWDGHWCCRLSVSTLMVDLLMMDTTSGSCACFQITEILRMMMASIISLTTTKRCLQSWG